MDDMIMAMNQELSIRAAQLGLDSIHSIYFGGGTPSLASKKSLESLLNTSFQHFNISNEVEVTIEVNPEDVNTKALKDWLSLGINRISLGVQSFYAEDLKWMNRAHDEKMAIQALELLFHAGFKNISIDLIFGYPLLTNPKWLHNIESALSFPIHHISCYSMTVEPKTALHHQISKGQLPPLSDDLAAQQYQMLMNRLKIEGFEHYEISNFGKPGYHSKHNSSYWNGSNYLGIGPSAHGHVKPERYWNIRQNAGYINAIKNNKLPEEREELTLLDQINESIMTGLRQRNGLSILDLTASFGSDLSSLVIKNAQNWLQSGHLIQTDTSLILSQIGLLLADKIMSDLFVLEDDFKSN